DRPHVMWAIQHSAQIRARTGLTWRLTPSLTRHPPAPRRPPAGRAGRHRAAWAPRGPSAAAGAARPAGGPRVVSYTRPPLTSPVSIIGATGALGFGLAVRWGRAGVPVVIGSRDAARAAQAADRAAAEASEGTFEGLE